VRTTGLKHRNALQNWSVNYVAISTAVIIPSLNSPIIDRIVAALRAQEDVVKAVEIIVVGIDDAKLVPAVDGVIFIDTGKPALASVARNRGVAATDAELLIFLDSDCLPTPDWLAEHVAAHQAGHPVVSGSVLPEGKNYWQLTYNLSLFHELLQPNAAGPRDFLATMNLSVERGVIDRVGLLDEQINRVEDVDWTTRMRRAGIVPFFWPPAAVWHEHNRTTLARVWEDCALSGYYMRTLRLEHSDLLLAPAILRYPRLVLALSPLIALAVTGRILWKRPFIVSRFWRTIPALYLTKIAWCWGASRPGEPS
jgi:GT2 family glycosyltransferase